MENNVKAFEKGEMCSLTIDDMSPEGAGIGRARGLVVFVAGAVVGDEIQAEITKVKKNYAFGRLIKILKASEMRVEPACGQADQCGGCPYASISYEGQLQVKEGQVRAAIERLGGVESPVIRHIIGMEAPWYYRNKAQMPVSTGGIITRKGGIVESLGEPSVGFFKAKSHEVVDCRKCQLQAPTVQAVAEALRHFMKEDNITGYDPKWDKGLMKHLIVKTAFGTGEVMVTLVINGKGIPNGEKLIGMMDDAINQLPPMENGVYFSLESVNVNINKGKSQDIMGKETKLIAGKPVITEEVGNLRFEISPTAFYQVNPVQMRVLYDKVVEYADLSGDEKILDLYCGVGTIGLYMLDAMRRKTGQEHPGGSVLGVEYVKEAVVDANRNAVINGMVNARYMAGRAEELIPQILSGYEDRDGFQVPAFEPDIIVLDPPRAGCHEDLLRTAAGAGASKIIYVSCNPATLARDIKILSQLGYDFVEATPVDMFPHTGHVETVCLLSNTQRPKKESYITLDVEMEDYYRIKNEGKKSTT